MCNLTGYFDGILFVCFFLTCFINECYVCCVYVCLCMYVFYVCVCLFVSPWLRNLPVTALDTLYSVGVNFKI